MMANRGALLAAVLICLCFVRFQGDAVSVSPPPGQEQEVQMLRSKVASLEDEISRRKEETSQLESVVRERTAQMTALVGELELLQKVNVADDESVVKANTHNEMLEKQTQIERLGSDLEDQVRKGESLEARAAEAENSLHEFRLKLESAEKTIVDQRKKIQELDDRLRHWQNKLSELEKEAKLKAEELAKVHGMWLPHWLVVRVAHYQGLASAKWHVHGKPVLDTLMQEVAEKSAHAWRLVEPYLRKAQIECKKLAEPYITRVAAASEPHLFRASAVLEPYMKPATSAWKRLVSSMDQYHCQVQKGVSGFLESNDLLSPLSADMLAWFTASVLFTLPLLSIYKIFSAAIRKKIQAKKDRGPDWKNRRGVDK